MTGVLTISVVRTFDLSVVAALPEEVKDLLVPVRRDRYLHARKYCQWRKVKAIEDLRSPQKHCQIE